jgi:[protein-PII] uridylyltransferase
MPEWEPSTGRVQHDIYHVYTVDQHALYAVRRCTRSRAAITRTSSPSHRDDPRGHAPVALRSARCCTTWASRTAARTARSAPAWRSRSAALGIEEEDTNRVEFLVRQHLVMGRCRSGADLEDLGMISDFARCAANEENLRQLYC